MDTVSFLRSRIASVLGFSHEGKRDLYAQFGYERHVRTEDLAGLYARNDIASAIIRKFPSATWRETPSIYDAAGDSSEVGSKSFSPFVAAVEALWERHGVAQYLERADRVSGIGRFGLLVMGFQDGLAPDKPLVAANAPLLYLAPYGELNASVNLFDMNPESPRYGKPLTYTVQTGDIIQGKVAPTKSLHVHHSRVIHLAEFLESDEVYGMPRLLPVYNRLKDLEKVVGGSAETLWLAANRGLAIWADPAANLNEDDIAAMKVQADEFQHQLRRYLVGTGMQAQVFGSESPDPEPNATVLLDLIAGAVGIPKRILLGTERGELSSAQDENNWAKRIEERRKNFATPSVLMHFVRKMIATGNIPPPQGKFWVDWPDSESISELDAANIAVAKSTALANYANTPGAELIVPVAEFRADILGLPSESEYEVIPRLPELPDMPEGEFEETDEDIFA